MDAHPELGGPATPAVGFGSGIERVLLALESQGIRLAEPRAPRAAVLYLDDSARTDAFALAMRLRAAGIETDYSYKPRGFSKQLQAAAKAGVRFAILVGGDEWARGEVVLKDLRERTQNALHPDALIPRLT